MSAGSLKGKSVWALGLVAGLVGTTLIVGNAWGFPPIATGKKKASSAHTGAKNGSKHDMPALSFKMKDIDGKEQDLRQYAGNVVLIVNTASKCGFTPQYKGLETIYEKNKDKGFVVLAFPANDFGKQEPGSDSQIKDFCTTKYDVKFPIFSKVSVKGDQTCDLYKYLTDKNAGHKYGGDIQWNFTKFLVNRKGELVGRFDSRVAPEKDILTKAIETALAEPGDSTDSGNSKGKGKGKH
jgi:glutathione peroxidase